MEENNTQIEQEAAPQVQEDNNFKYTDPVSNQTSSKMDEINKLNRSLLTLPVDTISAVNKFIEDLSKNKNVNNYREYFNANEASRMSVLQNASTYDRKTYEKNINSEDFRANQVQYGEKALNIREIEIGNKDVSPKTAIARFTKYVSAGEVIQVPLWHSGFWITLRPPKQKDFIILEQEIADNHIKLGRVTSTLAYSNYSVVVVRLVVNFIMQHITEYTVKLDNDDTDILDYINIQDLNTMILGVLSAIFPKGLEYAKTCRNNLLEEDGMAMCNNIIRATLDTKKLLFVNRKALSKDMLDHMSKRRPFSVSLDAVKEYQRNIASLSAKDITLLDGKVKITIENPSINKYIDVGEKWVEALIAETETLVGEGADISSKNAKLETLISTMVMGVYNAYAKSIITTDDNREYTDQSNIDTMLDVMSGVDGTIEPFISAVNEYISSSAIAIVGTPAYECPNCKQSDKDPVRSKYGFENLVPLNMLHLFFVLSVLSRQSAFLRYNTF